MNTYRVKVYFAGREHRQIVKAETKEAAIDQVLNSESDILVCGSNDTKRPFYVVEKL